MIETRRQLRNYNVVRQYFTLYIRARKEGAEDTAGLLLKNIRMFGYDVVEENGRFHLKEHEKQQ